MSKNIIIAYDGTGNEYGNHNTNVVKTYESIVRDGDQIGLYDPGVGTFSFLGRNLGRRVGIWMGLAFGTGLQQNIEDGYEYLMDHYESGDKVFIFGFSRGAFTARALAGMIHELGILQKGSKNLIPYVSKMYNNREFDIAEKFKKTFCHECKPHFIGVWDTVKSLGHIYGKTFFDQKLNRDVKYAYQAMSIDEKRKKFPVSLWDESRRVEGQTLEQVWFSGVHSDVGGSYDERGLSDIAFAWMMDQAVACGLKLKSNWREDLNQDELEPIHVSRKGFWKIWCSVDRHLPESPNIHRSVHDKQEGDESYAPKNIPADNVNWVTNDSYERYKNTVDVIT